MPTSYAAPVLPLRRSSATLMLALFVIVAMSVFFVREVVDLRQAMGEMRKNDAARIQVRNVMMHLLEAETGQRGYLLTGDKDYLAPYLRGRASVRDSLHLAAHSGFNDAAFLRSVRGLAILTDSKLGELERTVQLKKRGDGTAALNLVREGFGRQKMVEARQLIQGELTRLRLARERTVSEFNDRLLRAAVILLLLLSAVAGMAWHAWRSLLAAARNNNELAQRLALEASHDALTGLPNRRFFDRWAQRLVAKSQYSAKPFTLLAIDLDRFKDINDTHGHAVGDAVLKEVAARFQSTLRGGEFLARLGGDEFVVLMEGDVSRSEVASIGQRLIDALGAPLHANVATNAVGASIGASSFPLHGADLGELMLAADSALYESKNSGRSRLSFARTELASIQSLAHHASNDPAPALVHARHVRGQIART